MSNDNKKNICLNFLKGSQSHSPSQTNVDAKVQINIETAIPKLELHLEIHRRTLNSELLTLNSEL
jgi:hypothetical protein